MVSSSTHFNKPILAGDGYNYMFIRSISLSLHGARMGRKADRPFFSGNDRQVNTGMYHHITIPHIISHATLFTMFAWKVLISHS